MNGGDTEGEPKIRSQEMGRSPCCDENGLKKGPWTPEEDQKLVTFVQKHGHGSWRALPKLAGLNRCGKSCRLRWTNYLRPDIKRGKFSQEEEQTILHLHSILGNKWSAIASHLPGRTDNEIKNFWNTHLKKKLIQMGFDPMTHQPRTDDLLTSLTHLLALANLVDHHHYYSVDDHHHHHHTLNAIQLAKLQHLEHLLQSAASPGNGSIITNMDQAFSLTTTSTSSSSVPAMNIKENCVLSSFEMENNAASFSQPLHDPLPHLSAAAATTTTAPQVPFQNINIGELMGQNSDPNSPWVLVPSPSTTVDIDPPLSMNLLHPGDGSINISSYGGGPSPYSWSELFEDHHLINELS